MMSCLYTIIGCTLFCAPVFSEEIVEEYIIEVPEEPKEQDLVTERDRNSNIPTLYDMNKDRLREQAQQRARRARYSNPHGNYPYESNHPQEDSIN